MSVVRQDLPVWTLFAGLLVMFIFGSTGHTAGFAAGLVVAMAAVAYTGFAQWTQRAWVPTAVMGAVLAVGLGLVLRLAGHDVLASGTVLGFHPATAALVYVIWIPAFFTLGLAFVILSRRTPA